MSTKDIITGNTYETEQIKQFDFKPTGRFFGTGYKVQYYRRGKEACLLEDIGDEKLKAIVGIYEV